MGFSERLKTLCNNLIDLFNWDIDAEETAYKLKGSRSIEHTEDLKITVYSALNDDDYSAGIVDLFEAVPAKNKYMSQFVDVFGYRKHADFTDDNIEFNYLLAKYIQQIIVLYNDWFEAEFKMHSSAHYTLDGINPKVLVDVKKLLLKGSFKAHMYIDGGDTIGPNDKYALANVIGFSDNLSAFLNTIKTKQGFIDAQKNDTVYVALFGHTDKMHWIYSHWLFAVFKKNTIWLIEDSVNAINPHQKSQRLGRKSIWRDRGELYDKVDLPYAIFQNIDKLRAKQKNLINYDAYKRIAFEPVSWMADDYESKAKDEVSKYLDENNLPYSVVYAKNTGSYSFPKYDVMAKFDGLLIAYFSHDDRQLTLYPYTPEILFKRVNELKNGQRAFLYLFSNAIIEHLSNVSLNLDTVLLAETFVEQKLLTGGIIQAGASDTRMTYWTEKAQEIYAELLETLEGSDAKQVVPISYGLMKKLPGYDSQQLLTHEQLEGLSEWHILENAKNTLQDKLRALRDTKKQAHKQLFELKPIVEILKKLTHKQIDFIDELYVGFKTTSDLRVSGYIMHADKTPRGLDATYGRGFGKYTHDTCEVCNNNASKNVILVHIRHYKELIWLLGLSNRNELPKYFRQYRAHDAIPYSGNSLLDQTHPYLRLEDTCSRDNPNGLTFGIYMCGHCYRKHLKNIKRDTLQISLTSFNTIDVDAAKNHAYMIRH